MQPIVIMHLVQQSPSAVLPPVEQLPYSWTSTANVGFGTAIPEIYRLTQQHNTAMPW